MNLESLDIEPEDVPNVWRELGRDLARLHRGVEIGGPADLLAGWGRRPIAWLIDLLRFFIEQPGERWRAVAPPSP